MDKVSLDYSNYVLGWEDAIDAVRHLRNEYDTDAEGFLAAFNEWAEGRKGG